MQVKIRMIELHAPNRVNKNSNKKMFKLFRDLFNAIYYFRINFFEITLHKFFFTLLITYLKLTLNA